MGVTLRLQADGSLHLIAEGITWTHVQPAFDNTPVRPISVTIDGTSALYQLAEGTLRLTLLATPQGPAVQLAVAGMERRPFYLSLLGEVRGAARGFRTGLGFSGPSGFIPLEDQPALYSFESYLASALVAPAGGAVAIAALRHEDFLQRTTFFNRQNRRGLTARHIERDTTYLDVGFSTENVPVQGELKLPALHFFAAENTYDALRGAARAVAAAMPARAPVPPRYHWCSWYDRGPYLTLAELKETLAGFSSLTPRPQLQAVQIDDGYETSAGDWLIPNERWPGTMQAAFDAIAAHGYTPGIWVAPFMVGARSALFRDHPDWVIHDHDGKPRPEWRRYDGTANDEEVFTLDASHPAAREYIGHVFRTMRQWGAGFFKTDFLDWGFRDTHRIRRHNPDETSVQSFRQLMQIIRTAIGDESVWLACIAPYAPMIGLADSMRIANDVGSSWSEGGAGNMLAESMHVQYFNNVLWQNDPDATYLRDFHINQNDAEIQALAFWAGIVGESINTSDRLHLLRPDRLALWRFLRPQATRWTATLPYFDGQKKMRVAVRRYDGQDAWAVLVLNEKRETLMERYPLSELIGRERAAVFTWGPEGAAPLGTQRELIVEQPGHSAALYYVSKHDGPPAGLTLGGAIDPPA